MSEKQPKMVELKEGETYSWCACGKSPDQPFCDGGSHLGTGKAPKSWYCKESATKALCMCKNTKTPPFCDGSHSKS